MLKPRHIAWLFPILMSLYMVTSMTLVITWVNTGFNEGFISRWWRAFYIAWPIAFTLIAVGAPQIGRLVGRLNKTLTNS